MTTLPTHCLYLNAGEICPRARIGNGPFCPQHTTLFDDVDNRTLIEQGARIMKGMMYVNESKKLVGIPDVKLSGEFYNTLNELIARGYSEEESLDAFAAIVQEQGLFDDFYKQMGKDPKWKKFEKL